MQVTSGKKKKIPQVTEVAISMYYEENEEERRERRRADEVDCL